MLVSERMPSLKSAPQSLGTQKSQSVKFLNKQQIKPDNKTIITLLNIWKMQKQKTRPVLALS